MILSFVHSLLSTHFCALYVLQLDTSSVTEEGVKITVVMNDSGKKYFVHSFMLLFHV